MRTRAALVLACLLLLTGVWFAWAGRARLAEAAPVEEDNRGGQPSLEVAVSKIIVALLRSSPPGPLWPLSPKDTKELRANAARLEEQHVHPLVGTAYHPGGEWQGVIVFYADSSGPEGDVFSLEIVLLTPDAEPQQALRAARDAATKLGVTMRKETGPRPFGQWYGLRADDMAFVGASAGKGVLVLSGAGPARLK